MASGCSERSGCISRERSESMAIDAATLVPLLRDCSRDWGGYGAGEQGRLAREAREVAKQHGELTLRLNKAVKEESADIADWSDAIGEWSGQEMDKGRHSRGLRELITVAKRRGLPPNFDYERLRSLVTELHKLPLGQARETAQILREETGARKGARARGSPRAWSSGRVRSPARWMDFSTQSRGRLIRRTQRPVRTLSPKSPADWGTRCSDSNDL